MKEGRRKIEWAKENMPALKKIEDEFSEQKPLDGLTIGMAMHVEAKTAVLVDVLSKAGAEIAITGCNPLSTHDDVSEALNRKDRITSYAKHGVNKEEYYKAIDKVLDHRPDVTIDDGCDLIFRLHKQHPDLLDSVIGGCEETTTGVNRLRSMERDDALEYPVFAVNDTPTKANFDNVHGTGESSLSNIAMTTNLLFAGKKVVVGGYGRCGRGIAKKADGLGAKVYITETDPRRALEAHMEGYTVTTMDQASKKGDIFITATGNKRVIRKKHLKKMKNGAVLANAGHFNIEIDIEDLEELSKNQQKPRDGIKQYILEDGRKINLLAQGRLVNLASPISLGHPIEVMDQSFALQALTVKHINDNPKQKPGVYDVPRKIDEKVARIKLEGLNIQIDELTEEQEKYIKQWETGT